MSMKSMSCIGLMTDWNITCPIDEITSALISSGSHWNNNTSLFYRLSEISTRLADDVYFIGLI